MRPIGVLVRKVAATLVPNGHPRQDCQPVPPPVEPLEGGADSSEKGAGAAIRFRGATNRPRSVADRDVERPI